MNKHALIPLAIGLLVGIFALKLGYDHVVKSQAKGGNDMGPTAKVVTASKNIPLGTKLTAEDLTISEIPTKLIPAGTFSDPKDVIGQSIKNPITLKMPILADMIGPGEGLEGIIPDGYRAVAVEVNEVSSVGGLLRPGTKVDVLATFKIRIARDCGGGTETISKLVLQDIEVRAVGQQFRPENMENVSEKVKPSRSVTLLVKSEQAEALQLAASVGTIRLALRSATESPSPSQSKGITLTQLLSSNSQGTNPAASTSLNKLFAMFTQSNQKAAQNINRKATVKKAKPFVVEIMRGNEIETIYFASPNSDRRIIPESDLDPNKDSNKSKPTDDLNDASSDNFAAIGE
jgi:pilus assembly protein CpaB